LDHHFGYVTLSIGHAELERTEHDDLVRAPLDGDIIEIDFSVTQFADLLSKMNMSPGTPCTIRRLNRVSVERPPTLPSRIEATAARSIDGLKQFSRDVMELSTARVSDLLSHSSVPKKIQSAVVQEFQGVARRLFDKLPYAVNIINEAVTERVSAAKAELHAHKQQLLQELGLTQLPTVKRLAGPSDE
jgi:hypothetical protein